MTARLYVGTYAAYNNGSIKGAWLDLEDYSDREAFLEACAELHKTERDPELMFQDYEGFPKAFYSESHVPAELWDWLELDEHDRELLDVYQDHADESGTIEQARDAYYGQYDSATDWAAEYLDECGDIPEHLQGYIDYAAYARDSEMIFARHDGAVWVFSR
jgi:antirestriction protein